MLPARECTRPPPHCILSPSQDEPGFHDTRGNSPILSRLFRPPAALPQLPTRNIDLIPWSLTRRDVRGETIGQCFAVNPNAWGLDEKPRQRKGIDVTNESSGRRTRLDVFRAWRSHRREQGDEDCIPDRRRHGQKA
jgi:hypothetical protein